MPTDRVSRYRTGARVNGRARPAASRSASRIAVELGLRPLAEERERDVEALGPPASSRGAARSTARAPPPRRRGARERGRAGAIHRSRGYRLSSRAVVHGSVSRGAARGGAPPRRPVRGSSRDRPGARSAVPARRPGRPRGGRRGRRASPPFRHPGPRCLSRPPRRRLRAVPGAICHRRRASPPRPPRARSSTLRRHASSSSSLTSSAYATTPPRKTSLEPGIEVEPAGDEPSGARLRGRKRQAARAREVEHDLGDRALVLAEEVPTEIVARARSPAPRARSSAPGSTTRSTWISNSRAQIVTSTPSPSPPASASACATADSGVPKKRSVRRPRLGARATTLRTGSDSSARCQRRRSSRGGPGSTTTTQPSVSSTRPGAVPASPSDDRALRAGRLLSHAGGEVRVRPCEAARRSSATPISISRSSSASTTSSRPATRATSSTVRSSCVGPSPPETRQRSARERLLERVPHFVRPVADDRDPLGLEAEPEHLAGEKRPVAVLALAADELAARDDDRRPRASRHYDAGTIRREVTTKDVPAGRSTRFPLRRTRTFCGSASASWSRFASKRLLCPCSSVPL